MHMVMRTQTGGVLSFYGDRFRLACSLEGSTKALIGQLLKKVDKMACLEII